MPKQERRSYIIAAHEAVEDFNLFGIRMTTIFEAPGKDFLVRAALQYPLAQCLESNSEKPADAVVEGAFALNYPEMVTWWQLSLGLETDFVEDAPENHKASDGVSR